MNFHSYRSSPIRNLDTSQAVRERFEDEFFQIRCIRLEKEKKQLQDQVSLLNSKIVDSSNKTEELLILNTQISHLVQENQSLKMTIDQLRASGSNILEHSGSDVFYHSRQRMDFEHRKEVQNLLELYETAKAETLLFRKENQKLLNRIELQRSRGSSVDDLDKAMEISKLKISVSEFEGENRHLKEQVLSQQVQIERLGKLYSYEKRAAQEKQKEFKAINYLEKEKEAAKYYSVQENETPIKSMGKDYNYRSVQLEDELSQLRRSLEQQNELYQAAIGKYKELIEEHQQVVIERDQLRQGESTLRSTQQENVIENVRSQTVSDKKQKLASGEVERLKRQLKEKEEEIRSILTRFAPLTKIKEGEVSLEQDRKQRIEKHWKADLAILDVLLTKYKIQVF